MKFFMIVFFCYYFATEFLLDAPENVLFFIECQFLE